MPHVRYLLSIQDFIEQCLDLSLEIDGVITDAPYNHLEGHRSVGTTTRLQGEWFDTLSMDEITDIMNQMKDILTRGSHVYFWGNTHSTYDFKDMFKSLGYEYNNTLFWVKNRLGMGYSYRNVCEPILFVSNGKRRKVRDMAQKNVFTYPKPKKMPPFAKPPLIYEDILRSASRTQEIWLDPFAGTDPFSRLREKTYSLKVKDKGAEKKTWKYWSVHTIGVDVKFSDRAYPYPFKPRTKVGKDHPSEIASSSNVPSFP